MHNILEAIAGAPQMGTVGPEAAASAVNPNANFVAMDFKPEIAPAGPTIMPGMKT